MPSVGLSVIVAAFNEEASIGATLEDLARYLPPDSEVLVVDGGSDRTGEVVRGYADRVPGLRHIAHHDDRGKGHAIRTGMREARGEVQAQFDADGQFFAEDLAALAQPILDGRWDVSLGSRFTTGSGKDTQAHWSRDFGNGVVSAWASVLFGHRMTDVMSGIKAWRRDFARLDPLKSDRFEYEVEIPCRALRAGLRVHDVPVRTRARAEGESKVSVLPTGLRVLAATLRFRCDR
jgi:glycosyltransferase involved in cell wall biosynthesis